MKPCDGILADNSASTWFIAGGRGRQPITAYLRT
jgi:hypothetical protein